MVNFAKEYSRRMESPTLRQAAKRQNIINVATEMFLADGYSGVSVDGLIAKTGGSKRTIYTYFDGKEGLFSAIIEHLCAEHVNPLLHMDLKQLPLQQALSTVSNVFLDVVLLPRTIALHRLIVAEALRAPEAARAFFDAAPATAYGCLAEYLTWAGETGLITPGDAQTRARIFLDALTGDLQLRCLLGLAKRPSKSERERLIAEAITIFINGLSPV